MKYIRLYRPVLLKRPKPATSLGSTQDPRLFLKVTVETARYIRGVLEFLLERSFWTGTEQEIDNALDVISSQIAEIPLELSEICNNVPAFGIQLRFNGQDVEARSMDGVPIPPYEIRTTQQEDGSIYIEYRHIPE